MRLFILVTLCLLQGCQGDPSSDPGSAEFSSLPPSITASAQGGGGASTTGGVPATSGGTNLTAGSAPVVAGARSVGGSAGSATQPLAGGRSASGGAVTAGTASAGGASGGPSAGAAGSFGGKPAPSTCSGKAGAVRGSSAQMVTAAGLQRSFVYYAPPELDPDTAAPVVIVAHGWTMSGQQMVDLTKYQALADREGFVVMFPDGQPLSIGPWNVGDGACPSNLLVLPLGVGDDQAFIDAMLAFTESDRCVDRRHVFVTGFSMGGYFSNETGCLRPDIAAIAPHSGGSHDLSACPVTRKPVILFHGTADGLIPVTCGEQARARWVERNGCSTEVESVAVKGGHCEYSKGCPTGGQVALCLFDAMDHSWAGGEGISGSPDFEPATELSWEFFREYAWD